MTKDLANVLKSGKMPAPARIVQEDIVGPSLGQESINQGIISFVVALILLMIYMCAMYGLIPGMVANCALVVNFFFTLGILTSFQAALTMSGIAGMVLSLGMAVDANVLIYERTKEELRAGKTVKAALADGYSNAFSAIFDSNLTSIITGIILFYFGTGPIRGFATTLIIGILCSFFTAVFLTRIVYEHFMNKDKWLNLTFTTGISKNLMQNVNYNFMGMMKRSFTVFGAIIVICIISFFIRGLAQSIDFTGGRNFVVQFEQQVEPETVRDLLKKKITEDNVQAIALGTDKKTIRITTNYRINEDSPTIDSEIEEFLYQSLKDGNLLGEGTTLEIFIDRDNRVGGSIISSQKVGPSIADDIKTSAVWSVLFALVAIGLYILLRFRNVAYSVGATVALAVDTILIIGAYSLCYGWVPFSLEIDQTFIGAILTAIGYSINDKVVIFDRIREFFGLYPKRNRMQLFNDSLNTTLARTINTSLSTLIVLLCIFYWAGAYVSNDFVLVGTDDGDNTCTERTSRLLMLDAKNGKLLDSWDNLNSDIRSTVVYDDQTQACYFTAKGGTFYSVKVADQKLTDKWSVALDNGSTATPMSTSTPVVYNGRAYIGVSGTGQFSAYSGHNITVIDLNRKAVAYKMETQGYPQTSGLLTTAYEEENGYAYIYFFDNYTPGKLRVLRDKAGQTAPD